MMDLINMRSRLKSGKTIHVLPLRVAYYARVSSDTDEQINSLENQIAHFEEYIKSNDAWIYCGGYIDEGISGASAGKRGEFLRMIADAKKGLFDMVVTKEISRFARDTLDSIQYTRLLLESGVCVYFQNDNINTLDEDSELRLTIMASLAQDELRRLSERVRFGVKKAYDRGRVLGQDNIYGYDKAKGRLTVNEGEARFVRAVFELYAEGNYGYRTIARMLTEMGYRNQSGGELNPGSLKRILTNPKYKGYYHGRLTVSNNYRDKKDIKLAGEERLLYKDENIPAIVSEELWDKVNTILSRRSGKFKSSGRGTVERFAYSGKIFCGEHGTPHYRKVWKDRKIPAESWCCKLYLAKGRAACPTPHLYTRALDAIMEYIGNDILSNEDKYTRSADGLLALYERAGQTDYSEERARLVIQMDRVRKKQDKLLELYTDDRMAKEDYIEKDNRLKMESTRLKERLALLREEQVQAQGTSASLEKVREFLSSPAGIRGGSLSAARAMLESVTVLKGSTSEEIRLRIVMKYGTAIQCAVITPVILCGKTEVSPIIGTERQSEELVHYLLSEFDDQPEKIWSSNIFGKSLHDMVSEGLNNKLKKMPEDARSKLQETLQRIINEGSGGLICIIL